MYMIFAVLIATIFVSIVLNFSFYQSHHVNAITSYNALDIRRDVDLRSVTGFLEKHRRIFAMQLNTSKFAEMFIDSLTPWIIAEPLEPLVYTYPPEWSTDCNASRYKWFLSGNTLPRPRVIVDFVPFGFDVDKLEIRLLENFNNVAAFVIFESGLTQTGVPKPFIFDMVKDTPRFQRFREKIIHLTATADELLQHIGKQWPGWTPTDWTLEKAMRTLMVKLFRSMTASHPQFQLQQHVMAALGIDVFQKGQLMIPEFKAMKKYTRNHDRLIQSAPLAIQGDGDEIISGHVLHHLQQCELNSHDFPLYAPCVSYKHNINFMFKEDNIELYTSSSHPAELLNHLIAAGPEIDLLYRFILFNDTFRHEPIRSHFHTGLGSAVHLSSIHEPTEVWVKDVSTQHGMENTDIYSHFPRGLVNRILSGNISAAMLSSIFGFDDLCNISTSAHPVRSFSNSVRRFLYESLPVVLTDNPRRYPFIIPSCSEIFGIQIAY